MEHPLPQANTLRGAWTAAGNDAWAVGDGGAIVHWDGASWTVARSPTAANLYAIWGADAKHVWAGGAGVLLVFDGIAWQTSPSPTSGNITFITGSSVNDVWASASDQSVFHWDGTRWKQPGTSADRPAGTHGWVGESVIWSAGGGRAWSGGCTGSVSASLYFWDGASWTRTDPGVPGCVRAIAGTSPDDVWATSVEIVPCGKVHCPSYHPLHWDGARWSETSTGLPVAGQFFSPLRGEVWFQSGYSAAGDVFARREAGAFSDFLTLPHYAGTAVAAVSPSNVFMAGMDGVLGYSDGKTTQLSSSGVGRAWFSFWGDANGSAWAVGENVLRRENGRWALVDLRDGPPGTGWFSGVAGSAADDVWMASGGAAAHWDGHTFTWQAAPGGVSLTDVRVSPSGNAFFAGSNGLYRAEAGGFKHLNDTAAAVIWPASDTDIWLIQRNGTGSTLSHFDGSSTRIVLHRPVVGPFLTDPRISGSASDDVWAVVEDALLHFDGVSWKNANPPAAAVYDVTVAGRNDVWAVGADLWHFDGESWTAQRRPGWVFRAFAAGETIFTYGEGGRICRKP